MRIDNKQFDRNAGLAGAEAASGRTTDSANKNRNGRVSSGKDSVSLSAMADLIALASQVGESARGAHVSRIAAQYRSGTYVVNNEALADALMDRAFAS